MIIKEEKEQTINDLMADDVRVDFEAIAKSEHGHSAAGSVELSEAESRSGSKKTKENQARPRITFQDNGTAPKVDELKPVEEPRSSKMATRIQSGIQLMQVKDAKEARG